MATVGDIVQNSRRYTENIQRMKAKYMCRLMIQDLEEASLTD